nr:hypothetical protein [Chloroflexota bacterium]
SAGQRSSYGTIAMALPMLAPSRRGTAEVGILSSTLALFQHARPLSGATKQRRNADGAHRAVSRLRLRGAIA